MFRTRDIDSLGFDPLVIDTLKTVEVASKLGPGALGAYVISQVTPPLSFPSPPCDYIYITYHIITHPLPSTLLPDLTYVINLLLRPPLLVTYSQ